MCAVPFTKQVNVLFIMYNIPLAAKVSTKGVKAELTIVLYSYLTPSNTVYPTFAMELVGAYFPWRMTHEVR